MHVSQIAIKNFRLLNDVLLQFETGTTLIVGRNNSGKTSLTELFRRLLASESAPVFRLEDFSLSVHDAFWQAAIRKLAGDSDDDVRALLPAIEITLSIQYTPGEPGLASLSEFIIDLDSGCTTAKICIRYELADGAVSALFQDITIDPAKDEAVRRVACCRVLKDRVPKLYSAKARAIDPSDPTNEMRVEWKAVRALMHAGFINAQRGLDDVTHKASDVLAGLLESLFHAAALSESTEPSQNLVRRLEESVSGIQQTIDTEFSTLLVQLLPTFALFGYPGLNDTTLQSETRLDVARLLNSHTVIQYAGSPGINLPESYSGLGTRNLIYILLKLLAYFREYQAATTPPSIQLVFIEEPEVHLHPQMQAVFISKLTELAATFAKTFNGGEPWPVQFVVTTHSSHVANRAPFDSIRYFLTTPKAGSFRSTEIRDLRIGLAGLKPLDREFLHKYMTLTRCDLLFADKAVLIEGTTERLLLPRMLDLVEKLVVTDPPLSSQYISIVEVGGAYAHLFFDLVHFLDVPTLVITDLDAVKPHGSGHRAKCLVSEGTHTSNACIKTWFGDAEISPSALISKPPDQCTVGSRRISYQIPEATGGPCGRSFEGAFVLANAAEFGITATATAALERAAWEEADRVDSKADFAVKYLTSATPWIVPRYIREGLEWLAKFGLSPAQGAASAGAPSAKPSAPARPAARPRKTPAASSTPTSRKPSARVTRPNKRGTSNG